ncbi:hypothetical protein [Hyphomicrobium sp. D-2]|nr:hypothetical protein [Hyphomicrobium sp. D-2]MDH4983880.1 hypothetical protein [Hyphomicrobium sp. D-2]
MAHAVQRPWGAGAVRSSVGALEFPRDTFAADPRIAALNWVRDA